MSCGDLGEILPSHGQLTMVFAELCNFSGYLFLLVNLNPRIN